MKNYTVLLSLLTATFLNGSAVAKNAPISLQTGEMSGALMFDFKNLTKQSQKCAVSCKYFFSSDKFNVDLKPNEEKTVWRESWSIPDSCSVSCTNQETGEVFRMDGIDAFY